MNAPIHQHNQKSKVQTQSRHTNTEEAPAEGPLIPTEDAELNLRPIYYAFLGATSFCNSVRVRSSQFPFG